MTIHSMKLLIGLYVIQLMDIANYLEIHRIKLRMNPGPKLKGKSPIE